MPDAGELKKNFRCLKCRGNNCIVHNISLPQSGLAQIIPIRSGKYIFVTCALCGYTEIYDQSLYAAKTETEENKIANAQEA